MPAPRFPLATYRLQFSQHCTFAHATRIIPYLADLGISDCYTSPYLQTRPGSLHGYDIVDPTTLNDEVGSAADYQTFVDALNAHQMGHIPDIVPNHMHIAGPWNPWWQDVLENGQGARYAHFFDINWTPVTRELQGKVLLPILGEPYNVALSNGDITLCYRDGLFFIRYDEHELPLDPGSYALILNHRPDALRDMQDTDSPHVQELHSIIAALVQLPGRHETDPEQITVRYRDKASIQRRLVALTTRHPTMKDFINDTLCAWNGARKDPHNVNPMDSLLRDQAYRLAFWRTAGEAINYRRFFDVNELAAIRIEDPDVFRHVHQYLFSLLQSAAVHGLRIDHVDGLYDPQQYLEQCQEWACRTFGLPADSNGRSLFIIVEKILGKGEVLSGDWPVHGTTGYDFLHLLNNLFVDARHERAMDTLYEQFTHTATTVETLAWTCKNLIMDTSMANELQALGHQAHRLSEHHHPSGDFTLHNLTHALQEIIASFPVYRTYRPPHEHADINDRDQACLRLAVTRAKYRNPPTHHRDVDYIASLLLKNRSGGTPSWEDVRPFIMKFQQLTGPVMAKGIEDTALYRYHRLISLNEVGGDLAQFGIPVATFHERMRERQQQWPFSLSATSTHDTKRSEDVRARINVLSELPQEWETRVRRWHRLNEKKKTRGEGGEIPSRNEEYFLYQTLLGAWPVAGLDSATCHDFRRRIQAYMLKAIKEAKEHTGWINPNDDYEQAVSRFIQHILEPGPSNKFLEDFLPFQQTIARYGMYNALSQVALKIGCPGIPDFYQGSEIWNLTLVDPDNRRPVDFGHVHNLAKRMPSDGSAITETFLRDLMESHEDGRIKFHVTRTLLNYRKAHRELFQQGDYAPLETHGEKRHNLCAFQRTWSEQEVIVVVPRLIHDIIPDSTVPALGHRVWGHTGVALRNGDPTTRYRHVLTNQTIATQTSEHGTTLGVADMFQQLPLAVMERL